MAERWICFALPAFFSLNRLLPVKCILKYGFAKLLKLLWSISLGSKLLHWDLFKSPGLLPGNHYLQQSTQNYQSGTLKALRQLTSYFPLKRNQTLLMKSHIYVQNSPLAWRHGVWCKYLSRFFCIYSAMLTWGNLCMNPASPGLLALHHPLNKWLLWISLFQMWFTLSAAQMIPAELGDVLKYSEPFSCICQLLPQLLLVCLTQNWNLVQRSGSPG